MTTEPTMTPFIVFLIAVIAFTIMAMTTSKDVLPGLYTPRPKRKAVN